MKIMIDTRVPSCPRCSSALDKGIRGNTSYFFCPNCHTEYHVIDEGQAEYELLCEELVVYEETFYREVFKPKLEAYK